MKLVLALSVVLTIAANSMAAPPEPSGPIQRVDALRQSMGITRWEPQHLEVPATVRDFLYVPVSLGGETVHFVLEPYSVRTPSARYFAWTKDGIVERKPRAPRTVRGYVAEWPESRIAASTSEDGLRALVLNGPESWVVEPLSLGEIDSAGALHASYRTKDAGSIDLRCGNLEIGELSIRSASPPSYSTFTERYGELGVDADYEYYSLFSTEEDCEDAIEHRINQVSMIYEEQFELTWFVSTLVIRLEEYEDYQDHADDFVDLSLAVDSEWRTNFPLEAWDSVHLFTDKNDPSYNGFSSGDACTCVSAAVSEERAYVAESHRTALLAHEIGHQMGSAHCTPPDCHIMCGTGIGGCNGIAELEFGAEAAGQIATSLASNKACLTPVAAPGAPSPTAVTPSPIPTFGVSYITITGSDLGDASEVAIDWGSERIEYDRCAILVDSNTSIRILPPTPPSLGTALLYVSNAQGTSSGLAIAFSDNDATLTVQPPVSVSAGATLNFGMGGSADTDIELLIAVDDDTLDSSGVLENGTVATTDTLDALGLGDHSRAVPLALEGSILYSQFVELDEYGNVTAASNVVARAVTAPGPF